MKARELIRDNYIDPAIGFDISYHSIIWNKDGRNESLPGGGNIHYHSIPAAGTLPHSHEFAEIILIMRGGITHLVNGENRQLDAGTLIFVRPSDTHSFKPLHNESCEMLILAYQLEMLLTLSQFFENDSFMWRYTEHVMPPTFVLNPDESETLANRLLNVQSDPFVSPTLMKTKTKVILADLFTRYFLEDMSSLEQTNVPEWLSALCRKMQQEDNLKIGLKRMQKLACKTPEHLCKAFRQYLNKTPTEFLNELRVNYAARRLSDSKDEIMAISLDLNFQSQSHFYKLFKQFYGVTPAQYRKNAGARRRVL